MKNEKKNASSYFTTCIHLVSNKKINITKTFFFSTICVFLHRSHFIPVLFLKHVSQSMLIGSVTVIESMHRKYFTVFICIDGGCT